jgi:hypothetical protein
MHLPGLGWVDTDPEGWFMHRVHKPDPEPRYVDPEEERARVAVAMRAWRDAQHPPYVPWPDPEVPMRVIAPGSLPSAPARLLSALRSAQWRVVVTYARGTATEAREGFTGKGAQKRPKHYPAKIVGSYALRASLGVRRAVAVWWDSAGRVEPQGVLVWGDQYAKWVGIQEFERSL